MRYIPVGSKMEQDIEIPRFGITDLPVFESCTEKYLDRRGYLKPVDGSAYNTVNPYYPSDLDDRSGTSWYVLSLRSRLGGVETADPKALPSVRSLAAIGSGLQVDSILERHRNPDIEASMLADSAAIEGIAARVLERHNQLSIGIAGSMMSTLKPDEIAAAARPTSEHHAYPGTRLGILAGLALVEVPKPPRSSLPARAGLEPVIAHPATGGIGLFPKCMTVSGILYNTSTVRRALKLPEPAV